MNYNFIVNNEIIRGRPDLRLYTGNTGTYTFEFEFDEQWAGLQIFVAFTGNSGTYISKAENNRVTVPRELLVNPGSCRFGVYGTNSSDDIKRMSSNLIELEVVQGAYSDGTAPDVPTPDLWEALVTKTVPIIGENGNWWIWNIEEQGYIDSGVYASQIYDDTVVRQAIENLNSAKVDKVTGKGLSTNDFTDEDKTKLDSLKNYDDSVLQQAIENINGEKEDKANKVMSISLGTTNDTAYPSEKAVVEYVDFYCRLKGFESYFNKSNYIGKDAPSDRYPNSTAVYNYVEKRISPTVQSALTDPITVNTIYDLGVQTELVITLPSGQVGDFIQVDFISGSTATDLSVNPPTTLIVNSSSGLVGFDLSPETNTIYTLYFDWGVTGYDGTEVTYGWRFNYSEYSVNVV